MIALIQLGTQKVATVVARNDCCCARAHVGVENQVPFIGGAQDDPRDHVFWVLRGVNRLLLMVVLDVLKQPHVAWILAEGIGGQLTLIGAPMRLLVLVLLRYANRVEVEFVVVGLREPEDGLVSRGELPTSVQTVVTNPGDPVARDHPEVLQDREKLHIQRYESAVVGVRTHLPEDGTCRFQDPPALLQYLPLLVQVDVEGSPTLVLLADVVRRRRDD